ncbi:MAG TPA: exodeoxyribonuclease III [Alphaproteobacteria bacterium]|nr:exodeoxyribonuclease III [Alphaproteobacteria bacterium]
MKIATWNVNSLRTRLSHVTRWLGTHKADVLCLQETKVEDSLFPLEALAEHGYFAAYHGQKSYNGVAIIARQKPTNVVFGFNGNIHNEQSRVIAATVGDTRIISAYVPQGESLDSPKFAFKQEFYVRLTEYAAEQAKLHPKLVVVGDFNISFDDRDVDDPKRRGKQVMFTPPEREWLGAFAQKANLSDAFRLVSDESGIFSWWDYRMWAAAPYKVGMRIDYVFVSEALKAKVKAVVHSKEERAELQPSDHIPVMAELED